VETVRPLCILERTVEMDRAEADLWCALFTIVGGARPLITVEQVRQAVALSFNIGLDSLEVAVAEPEDFIVFLPDIVTTDMVFNGGGPFHAPGFSLFFRRWTRMAHNVEHASSGWSFVAFWCTR
jgi:hypothetical protein